MVQFSDALDNQVTLRGEPVELTATQYRLLAELSGNTGRILTYEQLLARVWKEPHNGDVRPIRTMMSAIRRKLDDDPANPTYIFNRRGLGYSMARPHLATTVHSPRPDA